LQQISLMNEAELILQLKSGNREAFAQLVSAYRNSVLNVCYRFLLNQEDAEDVSQEVFFEVYRSIKNFRGESKLSTWIYRIAATKSMNEIKRINRKKRISSAAKTLGIEKIASLIAGNERPDKALEDHEGFSILMKALNNLPENQRIALTLSKLEGHCNAEIAEIMQTTLTAVDSLIYRAKQNLKSFEKKQ
jgi:RNA polymerase sigma-70 factor, ECF subfamily